MAVLQYGSVNLRSAHVICEKRGPLYWPFKSKKQSPPSLTLEDEIHDLRKRMEEAFREQNSFTADLVIDLSRLLDEKINEYMRTMKKD
ncbi:aspartyl-phosphate phosphatase Spo0E family protein [Paenibacillus sp. y28]|uniref:aspartyl-phosphate phosphatase Spo0E family protein n=1 Tax=Paenibacillus sp. y28 TaxID=3129110 RepID=UPI003015AE01